MQTDVAYAALSGKKRKKRKENRMKERGKCESEYRERSLP
jgi:hypothetical protein